MVDETERPDPRSVAVLESAGVVVLDGPHHLIERMVSGDPGLARSPRVAPTSIGAQGALAVLASLVGAGSSSTQTLFQLDDVGLGMFRNGELAQSNVGGGWSRAFGHGPDGIAANASLKPVSAPPQQLATVQMAMTTLALTAAIQEVQAAVERVEAKVERLRDLLEAERFGDVVGANRTLRRRAEQVGFDGSLSDTDWLAIDDVGIQVEQHLEGLRAFVRKRLRAAEEEGMRIGDRVDALSLVGDIAETLDLLVIAEDSLFLFQQLRLVRIRDREPEHLDAAEQEARHLLSEQARADRDLLDRTRALVAERVTVGALEIHRFVSARKIVSRAEEIDGRLGSFGAQRLLSYETVPVPPIPGLGEAYAEARGKGTVLVGGARRTIGGLGGRVRRRGQDGGAAALEEGETALELPAEAEESKEGSRLTQARDIAGGKVRRLRHRSAPDSDDG